MSNGTMSTTSIGAQTLTAEEAAFMIDSGEETKRHEVGGIRIHWLLSEHGEQILVQGANGEYVKLH